MHNCIQKYMNIRKNGSNTNYHSRNHCKYLLTYHIMFVCKYRKSLLIKYGDVIKQIMHSINKKYEFAIIEIEVDKNHVHMMIETPPKLSPLQAIRVLKQQSAIEIWKIYRKELLKEFWKENTFWTDGYFLFDNWRSKW